MTSRVWLITGANSGLGLALAQRVLNQGDKVIAAVRNPSKIPDSLREAAPLQLDLSASDSEIKRAGQNALQIYGHVDVLVNNAGYAVHSAVEEILDDEFKNQFQTNVFGPMSLTRALLPSFRNQKSGYILNVSSVAGLAGGPGFGAYNASKAALEAASEALAAETAVYNIKVLIIVPGYFPTGFLSASATVSNPADTRPTIYTEPSQGYDVGRRIPVAHIKDRQLGDAEKAALKIYEAVVTDPNGLVQAQLQKTPWVRIQVGSDSALRIDGKLALLKANNELMRPISGATDMDEEQVERFAAEFSKQQAA